MNSFEKLASDPPSRFVVDKAFKELEESLKMNIHSHWLGTPVRESWFGELLITLHLKDRRFTYCEIPNEKTFRVVRYQRLTVPKDE